MALALPKIVYPSGGGGTLLPALPPRRFSAYNRKAIRHDSLSSSGKRQSVLERVDDLISLEFILVSQEEVDLWSTFMDSALKGNAFDYYANFIDFPATFITYHLTDTNWDAKFRLKGNFRFRIRARKEL